MAVVIASYTDDAIAPDQSTNRSCYKDPDVQPAVHIAPDLADHAPVSHLYLVQPLEAFFHLRTPCILRRHQHYSPLLDLSGTSAGLSSTLPSPSIAVRLFSSL
jgi:hypothetical protein